MCPPHFLIGKTPVGGRNPTFIIAEAGVNHNGDIAIAKKLIDAAKEAGAAAVKFQSFTASRLVSRGTPKVRHHKRGCNPKESHFDMIRKLELTEKFHRQLIRHCEGNDIIFLSTPYDIPNAQMLYSLGVKAFKTASADIVDIPLHEYIASTQTPAIVATGMATYEEIDAAVELYRTQQSPQLALLHCVSSYPAPHRTLNINVLSRLHSRYNTVVGYSDHSIGPIAAVTAVALGAKVIEKHFTLDKTLPGPDQMTSETPAEFSELVAAIRTCEEVLGDGQKRLSEEERDMHQYSRKSLVAARTIPAGTRITEDMLVLKRPGTGLPFSDKHLIVGQLALQDIAEDTVLTPSMTAR